MTEKSLVGCIINDPFNWIQSKYWKWSGEADLVHTKEVLCFTRHTDRFLTISINSLAATSHRTFPLTGDFHWLSTRNAMQWWTIEQVYTKPFNYQRNFGLTKVSALDLSPSKTVYLTFPPTLKDESGLPVTRFELIYQMMYQMNEILILQY